MIDAIYTAMSGLQGHERGLSNISSNVANMNTPGFKGSHIDFTDVFSGGGNPGSESAEGRGLDASHVSLNMAAGEIKKTGRDLDLAIGGDAFFTMRDDTGALRYTRNGGFEFDDKGVLVQRGGTMKVQGHDATGKLVNVSLDGLRSNAPAVTTEVTLSGNLSSTDTDHSIEDLAVYDKLGGNHSLKLSFTNGSGTEAGSWVMAVFEGTTQLGSGKFVFTDGKPTTGSLKISLVLNGATPSDVNFTLDADTTGFSSGTTSTLALKKQDGHASGQISSLAFDERGVLKIGYSNGEKADGPALVLAQMQDDSGLVADGAAVYTYVGDRPPVLREASDDLRITPKSIEMSNVDLTSEFSALILMQRGYQASSQVVTTANEMLQQLFEMKGAR